MIVYAPDYYNKFACIADKCRHSCCIGWEIDIDENTHNYYKTVSGNFGKRLSDNISINETPHFILDDKERCPFLNENNLCDICIELGEENLCQICTDHPRFRNFFSGCIEIGVGICCEAAARLVLTQKNKTRIVQLENGTVCVTDEETAFFAFRKMLLDMLQNRSLPLEKRIEQAFETFDISLPEKSVSHWADIFLSLENMESEWQDKLKELKIYNIKKLEKKWELPFEQLLVYFIYRHLANGLYDGSLRQRIAFAVLSIYVIYAVFSVSKKQDMDNLVEISRLYSAEIEYSEENLQKIIGIL